MCFVFKGSHKNSHVYARVMFGGGHGVGVDRMFDAACVFLLNQESASQNCVG